MTWIYRWCDWPQVLGWSRKSYTWPPILRLNEFVKQHMDLRVLHPDLEGSLDMAHHGASGESRHLGLVFFQTARVQAPFRLRRLVVSFFILLLGWKCYKVLQNADSMGFESNLGFLWWKQVISMNFPWFRIKNHGFGFAERFHPFRTWARTAGCQDR